MEPLHSVCIPTSHGDKTIAVFLADIIAFDQQIDILTTSAYRRSYNPTPGSMFRALDSVGISVRALAREPEIDLRELCNIWLSKSVDDPAFHIKRIGCIEMSYSRASGPLESRLNEQAMLRSIKAYFKMLDIAADCGVSMETVAIPVLGSGSQKLSVDLTLIPIFNECVDFLKRNSEVKRIFFVERSPQKAFRVAQMLANSYSIVRESNADCGSEKKRSDGGGHMAFISYSSNDRNVADNLCAKLESRGVKVWYAPRNVHGNYASAIAEAITRSTHFVVILSKNSLASEHVLNEIDLAFKRLPNNIKFNPLRIDTEEFAPAFEYYLSRQHWMDAHDPPLEQRLNEFVDAFMENI